MENMISTLTLSFLKTATAVERIFPFIPENRQRGAGINTPFLPAGRCSGFAFEIRAYLSHGQHVSVTGPEECFDKPHNALISRTWPLPECGKVYSAQNLSISRDGVRLFCTVGKMAADEYNDSDQFSDDDVYDNLGENNFDLFELTEEERAELANAFKDDSESGDELDDENLPLFFTGSATL